MSSDAGTLKTLFISAPDCSFLWKGSRLLPCCHQLCANLGARIVFTMRRHIENDRCPLLGLIGLPFRYGGIVRVAGCGKIDQVSLMIFAMAGFSGRSPAIEEAV